MQPATAHFDRRTLLKLSALKLSALGLAAGFHPAWAAEPLETLPLVGPDVRDAADASNRFGLDLGTLLSASEGNLFFSPASIAVALAMTSAGAEGQTRQEMIDVLHGGYDVDRWSRGMGEFARLLNVQGEGYVVRMANRLWGQQDVAFHAEYLNQTEQDFGASLGRLDFCRASERSRATINDWVRRQTHGRIEDLLPEGSITTLTRLVLTNAIYFKADWQQEFDVQLTKAMPFTRLDGRHVDVPMMRQEERFGYAEDDTVQVLEMPYQAGGLSMVVVLPKEVDGIRRRQAALTKQKLDKWLAAIVRQDVVVSFPKFKMEGELNLNSTLSQLGMPRAFSDFAEFGRMTSEEELKISDAVHKAFVEVNETGTEAAAATGVVMATRATTVSRPPKVFRADHPFWFMIRHQASNAILFAGRMESPAT